MNKVILMGRLTADPELKKTSSDLSMTRFSIAVNRRFAKEGQQQADFINCIAWRHTAEFISKYFRKGNMLAVVGSIQTSSYEKDGRKLYTTEVLIDETYFCGSKSADAQQLRQVDNQSFGGFDYSADEGLPF